MNQVVKYRLRIKTQFLATVEFGVLSKNCRNYGICRVQPISALNGVKRGDVVGIITVYDRCHLEIGFLKKYLGRINYNKYFSKNYFLIQEDYRFTEEELGVCPFTIPRGVYAIEESDSMIRVIFQDQKSVA